MQTHIDRAMGMLRGSSLSLIEIAAACGFVDGGGAA
jgi:transcriptional regulator GlxA family with amidase domain